MNPKPLSRKEVDALFPQIERELRGIAQSARDVIRLLQKLPVTELSDSELLTISSIQTELARYARDTHHQSGSLEVIQSTLNRKPFWTED